jgi:bacillithiol system protein YtxJ
MSLFKTFFGSPDDATSTNSNVKWNSLVDLGQLNDIIELSTDIPVIIFKHSTRCSISRMALRQFENEFDLENKVTPFFLDLLNHRDVSAEIARQFGVEHQSPQVLLISKGKSVYDASHSDISVEAIHRYL